ncbi:MAG TPA: glycine cleavage T C-terminal barrel domain-containing protein [Isosphaeraceae bacterium]
MTGPDAAHHAAHHAVGLIDRSGRVRLAVTGPDRARFLHNLTTNDVKRLPAGRGCEAFVTSLQGKTLGYVTLLVADDRVLLRTDPGGLEFLLPHFAKYGALDDVAWEDVSAATCELHLAGPDAETLIERAGGAIPEDAADRHLRTSLAGREVLVAREAPVGPPGLTVIGRRDDLEEIGRALRREGESLGLVDIDPATAEALRIEAGTPAAGRDVRPENLPQELGRDDRAISFVKGCYLGQETVARIDALGHVNKILKGLRIAGAGVPAAGTPLEVGGKPVGAITSAAHSPAAGGPIALAFLKVTCAAPGTEVTLAGGAGPGTAVVLDLPMKFTPPAPLGRGEPG